MNHWFTSDLHIGHANIIEYSNRPFEDVDEMNEAIVTNWNSVVRPGDLVYVLGDFALCDVDKATKTAKRLLGQKFLVFGNHDKRLRKDKDFMDQWIWGKDYAEIKVADQKIILCHFPFLTWNGSHHGSWSLHGHSHGSLPPDTHARRVDVGVDCWNYFPVHFDELKKVMDKKVFKAVDHHGHRDEE